MFLCYMTSVLHTARFSNGESVVCVNGNEFSHERNVYGLFYLWVLCSSEVDYRVVVKLTTLQVSKLYPQSSGFIDSESDFKHSC